MTIHFFRLSITTSIRVPLVTTRGYAAVTFSRGVLLLGLLAGTGCAIGGIEPNARNTPPGENLVVDVARAVDRLSYRVAPADREGAGYEHSSYKRAGSEKPDHDSSSPREASEEVRAVQLAEPVPPGPIQGPPTSEAALRDCPGGAYPAHLVDAPCHANQGVLAPPAAPPVGPPGRFFPVPTRPVFWP